MVGRQFHFTRIITITAIAVFLTAVFTTPATAAINQTINFQGKLVNKTTGLNVPDGTYSMTFGIFDDASLGTVGSCSGHCLWTETQASVSVSNGIFQVALGSSTAFGALNFNQTPLYLDITFNSEHMTTRVLLTSVPTAFHAQEVTGLTVASGKTLTVNNTITFGGTDSTSFTLPTASDTLVGRASTDTLTNKTIGSSGLIFSGATTDITTASNEDLVINPNGSGNVGIFATSPAAKLHVDATANSKGAFLITGDGNQTLFNASASGSTKFLVDKFGNVGIGTNVVTSGFLFDVNGNARVGGNLTITGTCTGCGSGTSYFSQLSGGTTGGVTYLGNTTSDFLIGGSATNSAKFSVININSGIPTASIAGILTIGNGLSTGGSAGNFIRSAYGAINFQYKSGGDAWSTGLSIMDLTGNVGIGTTGPTTALQVAGSTGLSLGVNGSTNGLLSFYSSSAGKVATIQNDASGNLILAAASTGTVKVGSGTGSVNITLTGATDQLLTTKTYTQAGAYTLNDFQFQRTLTGAGNSQGGSVLYVYDNSAWTTPTTANADLILANEAGTGTTAFSGNLLRLQRSGVDRLTLNGNGNLDLEPVTNDKYGLLINGDGNQTLFTASISGVTKFVIDKTGNVGIGTVSPTNAKLDIVGSLNLSSGNTLKINGSDVLSASALTGITTASSLASIGTITTGIWHGTVLGAQYGGTGANLTTGAAQGDILYADSTTTFTRLALGNSSQCLIGGTIAPAWGPCSGTGTSQWTTTGNDIYYATGNVGIGTTQPKSALHVTGNGAGNTIATFNQTDTLTNSNILTASFSGTTIFNVASRGAELKASNPVVRARLTGTGTPNFLGLPMSVDVQGRYAYVVSATDGTSSYLTSIDISNPDKPVTVSKVTLGTVSTQYPEAITVAGNYAYIIEDPTFGNATASKLVIYDISNPKSMTLVSAISGMQNLISVQVQGQYAYLVGQTGAASVYVVDVANPSAPRVLSNTTDGSLAGSISLYVQGKYAYVTAFGAGGSSCGLVVFDISNPHSPTKTGDLVDNTHLCSAGSIYVSGKYAYILTNAGTTADSFVVVDVSDPTTPTYVSQLVTNGTTTPLKGPNGIKVAGNYAYVNANTDNTLDVIDVSNAASPTLVGKMTGVTTGTPTDGGEQTLDIDGKYAYYIHSNGGTGDFVIAELTGFTAGAVNAGSLNAGQFYIDNDGNIGNNLTVGGGLNVGGGGIYSAGSLSISDTGGSTTTPKDVFMLASSDTAANNNAVAAGFFANRAGGIATSIASISAILTDSGATTYTGDLSFSTAGTAAAPTERMRIDANGNVGIGTTAPIYKLDLQGAATATAAAEIFNTDTGTQAQGLIVKLGFVGTGTPRTGITTGNSFIQFQNGQGRGFGAIDISAANTLTYRTGGWDFAEFFKKADANEDLPAGTIVCFANNGGVTTCSSADSQIIGIVSNQAGFSGGSDHAFDPDYVQIGLLGHLPVTVTDENGPVKAGDFVTMSSRQLGAVTKAVSAGYTVGRAIDSFDATTQSAQINILVQPGWADPGIQQNTGIAGTIGQQKTVAAIGERVTALSVSGGTTTAGLSVTTPKLTADKIFTKEITTLPDTDLEVNLSQDRTLFIKGTDTEKPAVSIDTSGNATFSGTLRAKKVVADQIEGLEFIQSTLDGQTIRISSLSALFAGTAQTGIKSEAQIGIASLEAQIQTLTDQDRPASVLTLSSLTVDGLATVSANLRVRGNGLVEGFFNVIETLTTKNFLVTGVSDFLDNVLFHKDVAFQGRATFNSDSAGFALVKKDADFVAVTFDKEYDETPVVNATLITQKLTDDTRKDAVSNGTCNKDDDQATCQDKVDQALFDMNLQFAVTRVSTKGFMLHLNRKVSKDVTFSWSAMSITKAKTFQTTEDLITPTKTPPSADGPTDTTKAAVMGEEVKTQ